MLHRIIRCAPRFLEICVISRYLKIQPLRYAIQKQANNIFNKVSFNNKILINQLTTYDPPILNLEKNTLVDLRLHDMYDNNNLP